MKNHPESIDRAMVKAIRDGTQTDIHQYILLPEKDLVIECVVRAHRVNSALRAYEAYEKAKGGEKET